MCSDCKSERTGDIRATCPPHRVASVPSGTSHEWHELRLHQRANRGVAAKDESVDGGTHKADVKTSIVSSRGLRVAAFL